MIYAATGGRVKPSKHLVLGFAFKKLTSSRKVADILCRLGHMTNYHLLEELETELTMNLSQDERITPHDMRLQPLSTGLAWDNYDRNVETLDGKETLHDTVGIVYQNVNDASDVIDINNQSRRSNSTLNSNDEGNTHEEETTDSEHIPCEVEEAEENVRGHIGFSTLLIQNLLCSEDQEKLLE